MVILKFIVAEYKQKAKGSTPMVSEYGGMYNATWPVIGELYDIHTLLARNVVDIRSAKRLANSHTFLN